MSLKSDANLGKDIIEFYKPYRQQKKNYRRSIVKDKQGIKHQFSVPHNYEMMEILGKGSYGVVCAGENKKATGDEKIFAIKKIHKPFEHKILTKRMLRELHLLKLLNHENIIKIESIFMPLSREEFEHVYVSFQFMDTDLHQILKSEQTLSREHYRFFLYQIIRGLKYMHSAGIVHRDLKPRNLLVNQNCDLKICDFGLARSLNHKSKSNELTDYVATRWYRAPQLLLSSYEYDQAVDMWSVGCIFAEMLLRKPFMKGKSTKDQLQLIADVIGIQGLDKIEQIQEGGKKLLKKLSTGKETGKMDSVFKGVDETELKILKRLLAIDPKKRMTAEQALKDPYFGELHVQSDEPSCKPFNSCDFEFEEHNLNTQQLKDILYEEILTYNFPKFSAEYEEKRRQNKSLISHILNNSNKYNKDSRADQSEEEYDELDDQKR